MTSRNLVNEELSARLSLATTFAGGALTARLAGELDIATQGLVRATLAEILAVHRPRHLIIDVVQLDFCDCAGVRALTDTRRAAARYGTTCTVRQPQPQVRWILQAMDVMALLGVTTGS